MILKECEMLRRVSLWTTRLRTEWDCQDYVLEILDNLEEEFVLDRDDEDYIEARQILMDKRGAIV